MERGGVEKRRRRGEDKKRRRGGREVEKLKRR